MTAMFSWSPVMHVAELPLPPSRQCSVEPARNFTQPSCMNCHVERSVAIGFSSVLPLNGSRKNVLGLASLRQRRLHHLLLALRRG